MLHTIRQASPLDARAIARVHVDSWRWIYASAIPATALAALSVDERADAWRSLLLTKPRSVRVWVAEAAPEGSTGGRSEVIGFAQAGPSCDDGDDPTCSIVQGDVPIDLLSQRATTLPTSKPGAEPQVGELFAIYLHPDVVERGIGKALMAKAEQFLCDESYLEATLWVLDTNTRARRFYESLDWQPDGATQDEPGLGYTLHEVRYRKRLRAR